SLLSRDVDFPREHVIGTARLRERAGDVAPAAFRRSDEPPVDQDHGLCAAAEPQIDSALYYYKIADSTLVGDVAITLFDSTDTGRDVKVMVTNTRERPTQRYKSVFEFRNLRRQVVATDTVRVAQAPPGPAQEVEVK